MVGNRCRPWIGWSSIHPAVCLLRTSKVEASACEPCPWACRLIATFDFELIRADNVYANCSHATLVYTVGHRDPHASQPCCMHCRTILQRRSMVQMSCSISGMMQQWCSAQLNCTSNWSYQTVAAAISSAKGFAGFAAVSTVSLVEHAAVLRYSHT